MGSDGGTSVPKPVGSRFSLWDHLLYHNQKHNEKPESNQPDETKISRRVLFLIPRVSMLIALFDISVVLVIMSVWRAFIVSFK